MVSPHEATKLDQSKFKRSENGHNFVHSTVKKGILPTILGVSRYDANHFCSTLIILNHSPIVSSLLCVGVAFCP